MRPALPSFVRSSTFRLSLFYVLLFFLSVGALLAFIYVQTAGTIDVQSDQATKADAAALIQDYTAQGIAGLIDAVEDRVAPDRAGDGLYLLQDEDGAPLAGNIHAWPVAEPDSNGWISFAVDRDDGPHRARGLTYALKDGSKLLVARDLHARLEFQGLMLEAFYTASALTLVLGVGGGLLISRWMLARLGVINRTAERIMAGDLSHHRFQRRVRSAFPCAERHAGGDQAADDRDAHRNRQYRSRSQKPADADEGAARDAAARGRRRRGPAPGDRKDDR